MSLWHPIPYKYFAREVQAPWPLWPAHHLLNSVFCTLAYFISCIKLIQALDVEFSDKSFEEDVFTTKLKLLLDEEGADTENEDLLQLRSEVVLLFFFTKIVIEYFLLVVHTVA